MKNTIRLLTLATLLLTSTAALAQKKWKLWLPQYTMEAVKGSKQLRDPFNVGAIDEHLPGIYKTADQVLADDRADYVEDMYIINITGIAIPDSAFDQTKFYNGTDVIPQNIYLERMNRHAHKVLLVAEVFFTHNKRILMRFSDCYDYKDSVITNDPKAEIWQVVDHLQPSLVQTATFYTPNGRQYHSRDSLARYSTVSDLFYNRFRKVLRFSAGRTFVHRIITDVILSKTYFINKRTDKVEHYERLIASHQDAILDFEQERDALILERALTADMDSIHMINDRLDSLHTEAIRHAKLIRRYTKIVERNMTRMAKLEQKEKLSRFQSIELNGAYRNSELNVFGNLNDHMDNKTLSQFGTPGDGLHKKIALRLMRGTGGRLAGLGTVEFNFVPYYGHTVRKNGNMVVIVMSETGQEVNLDETPDY